MKTIIEYPRAYKILKGLKRIPGLHGHYRSAVYWLQHRQNDKQRKALLATSRPKRLAQESKIVDIDVNLAQFVASKSLATLKFDEFIFCSPDLEVKEKVGRVLDLYPQDADFLFFPSSENDQSYFEMLCQMEFLEIGPRIYDRLILRHGERRGNLIVLEGVGLESASKESVGALIQKVSYLKNEKVLNLNKELGDSEECLDLVRNQSGICKKSGSAVCLNPRLFKFAPKKDLVDFLFDGKFESLRFTDVPWYRDEVYPYQSIPDITENAKRDMEVRWVLVKELIESQNLSLENRMVIDICCSSGIFMSYALGEGATWALGWDIPEVAEISTKLQRILGFSRMDMFGRNLDAEYPLLQDIPPYLEAELEGSVVFLFSAVLHVGFLKEIEKIPWKYLVFEGHEEDDLETRNEELKIYAEKWGAQIHGLQKVHDGDCFPRPLAILVRD